MKYIRIFPNMPSYQYERDNLLLYRPSVSLLLDDWSIEFYPYKAQVGDYLYSDMTFSDELISDKTPIGLCVAPASHFPDGKARWMSLVHMSATDPEHGTPMPGSDASTNPGAGFCWGYNQSLTGIRIYANNPKVLATSSSAVTTDNPIGFVNQISTATGSYLFRGYDNQYSSNQYPFNPRAWGIGTIASSSMNKMIPYQFNSDWSKNDVYGTANDLTEDVYGFEHTQIIMAAATKYLSGTITKGDKTAGSFPAATACYRFNAGVPALSGKWYLPAIGELAYIPANITFLNQKLAAIGETAITVGTIVGYTGDTSTSATNGARLWSSSLKSNTTAWILVNDYATILSYDKGGSGYNIKVRAFLAY